MIEKKINKLNAERKGSIKARKYSNNSNNSTIFGTNTSNIKSSRADAARLSQV